MAGDLLQVFNAATKLGNAYIDQQRYLNTQIANEEVKNLQLDFNDKLNATMSDLSRSGDWSNYDEKIDDFYSEYRNTAESMVSSPYASRIVNDMLNQSYQDTKWKVKSMQIQAQKNSISRETNNTLENLVTSNVDANYAIAVGKDSLNGCLANNVNTENYTQNAVTFFASTLMTKAQTAGTSLINSGASWEQVEAKAKEVLNGQYDFNIVDTNNFSTYDDVDQYGNAIKRIDPNSGTVDASKYLDREKITNDTLKNLKAQWVTKRKELQEGNDDRMEELYTAIVMGSDGEYDKNYANAKNFLSGMSADTLPDKRLKYWADTLASMENDTAKGETTPKGNSVAKVKSARTILKDNMPLFVNKLVMGTGDEKTVYAAEEAFTLLSYDDYTSQMKEAGYDMIDYSYTDFITEGADIINDFVNESVKAGYIPKEVGVEMNNTDKLFNDYVGELAGVKKDKNGKYSDKDVKEALAKAGINYEDEMTLVRSLYWDIVKETDWNDKDAVKNAHDRMKKLVGSIYVSRIDNKNEYKIERKWGENETGSIARVVHNLEKDETAYTLNDSDSLWSGKRNAGYAYGVEEERENNSAILSSVITKNVGNNLDLIEREEYTSTDVSANPVFTDKNTGDDYKVISEDGKNYSIVKRSKGSDTWVNVKTVSNEGIKEEDVVGGNATQYQIEQYLNGTQKKGPTEEQINNSKTSEVVAALEKRKQAPLFYEGFFSKLNIARPKDKYDFEEWWNKTTPQKRQQYMEWLRDNYPNRYGSIINGLPEILLADEMTK